MSVRIDFKTGTFYLGDCFDVMATLDAGSVDMVLNDPPYGTTSCVWDSVLPLDQTWTAYRAICKTNAAMILTANQPFSSVVVSSNFRDFRYCWVWEKHKPSGHLRAKLQPMRAHEDVLLFASATPAYFPQGTREIEPRRVTRTNPGGVFGKQAALPSTQTTTDYPRTVLKMPADYPVIHPTQKPVALFEYLIRTYTNPGELVLDNTAGSGTTAIAAIQSGRRWICIERDPTYFEKAIARAWEAEQLIS